MVNRTRSRGPGARRTAAALLCALGSAAATIAPTPPSAGAPRPLAATQPRAPVAQPVQKHPSGDARFAAVEHDYVTYVLERFPVVASYLGGAGFDPRLAGIDGRLRDYSPQAIHDEDAHLAGYRARFAAISPAGLTPRRRIDRSVALAQIAFLEHEHTVRRHQQKSLDSYVDEPFRGVDWQIQGMTSTGGTGYGTEAEWQAVIARVRAIPAYLATAERQLSAGVAAHNTPDRRVLTGYGLDSSAADAEYFAKTLQQIAASDLGAGHDALLGELQAAGNDAAGAYTHLRAFVSATFFDKADPGADPVTLKSEYRGDHFAFGEPEYDWALHNNLRLSTTAAELYTQSWPVVEGTRAEMITLARQIAASHQWSASGTGAARVREVFEQLSRDAPRTDAEMLEGYRKTGQRLVEYARDTGLFDVPADYRLDVTITPPPLRASIEGAAYYPAPPFKKTGVGRFYVTPTGDDLALLRAEHNYAAMPDLAAHEGFPGHDWHYKVMTEYRDEISPVRWLTPGAVEDSSSMWEDSMAAEGWALYAEALLAEPQPKAPHGLYTPRGAALSAAWQATARSAGAHRHRHSHRPAAFRGRRDAVFRGGRFPAGLVPGRGEPQACGQAGELRRGPGRGHALCALADPGDHLPARQGADPGSAPARAARARGALLGPALPSRVHEAGHDSRWLFRR